MTKKGQKFSAEIYNMFFTTTIADIILVTISWNRESKDKQHILYKKTENNQSPSYHTLHLLIVMPGDIFYHEKEAR